MQSSISDGFGDDTLATRQIVRGIGKSWGTESRELPAFYLRSWHRPDTGDMRMCGTQMRVQSMKFFAVGGPAFAHMYGAIVREEQTEDKEQADWQANQAFIGLPSIVLGALAQCMGHSLLEPACSAWANEHLDSNRHVQAKVDALLLANAKIGDDQACILLGAGRRILAAKTDRVSKN
jgi:hypothetical protein